MKRQLGNIHGKKACAQCGDIFTAPNSRLKVRLYCSKACAGLSRRTGYYPGKYSRSPGGCVVCGRKFNKSRNRTTCSAFCAGILASRSPFKNQQINLD